MKFYRNLIVTLLACFSFTLFISGMISSAYAEQKMDAKQHLPVSSILSGKVTDIINVPGYTYAEVNIGKKKVWAAGPVTSLKVGDAIAFSTRMPMKNFHSKSMMRDFSVVYFVDKFITGKETNSGQSTGMPSSHTQSKQEKMTKAFKGIKKVEGGFSIFEIYTDKENLKGKALRVRGKVTKSTANVLGTNWLHIRDSSTQEDLTVTTKADVDVDDIVVVEGKLELDKDFGYGYLYPLILLDAKVVK